MIIGFGMVLKKVCCSFCGADNTDLKMCGNVDSNNVWICEECVRNSNTVMVRRENMNGMEFRKGK